MKHANVYKLIVISLMTFQLAACSAETTDKKSETAAPAAASGTNGQDYQSSLAFIDANPSQDKLPSPEERALIASKLANNPAFLAALKNPKPAASSETLNLQMATPGSCTTLYNSCTSGYVTCYYDWLICSAVGYQAYMNADVGE